MAQRERGKSMSEYQDTSKFLDELMALESMSERERYLEKLTPRQIQLISWRMPYMVSRVKQTAKLVKAAHIERSTNYDKLIKEARKRFTDLDIEILEMLDDDMSWYARGIHRQVNETEQNNYSIDEVRKRLGLLKRRGLIEVISGLFNEDDGMLAGSGYSAVYKQRNNIEKIIASYKGENDTKELL